MSPAVDAVLFDADQTLWDFQLVMRRALAAVRAELVGARPGPETTGLSIGSLAADRTAVAEARPGELDLVKLRRLGFERTLQRLGLVDDGLSDVLTESYFTHRDAQPELFDDTLPCLEELRGRYRLGVLSNGSRLPERCGLEGFFDVVVFAQHHGSAKPDRRLFEITAEQLDLPGERCVLVGDHPRNDIFGAKRAGWRAVWIDRETGGRWDPAALAGEHAVADAIITSLADLPRVLADLG